MAATSLYLHIPFCSQKCGYCGFASVAGQSYLHRRYCLALQREISELLPAHRERERLATLFVGGGTPTVLDPDLLAGVLRHCATVMTIDDETEFTLEANPETLGKHDLASLRRQGVNRLSLGVQSLSDRELVLLGRAHDAPTAIAAVAAARREGIANLSIDLIYGLPFQQVAQWRTVLRRALDLYPEHLSIYQLSIEPDTPFARLQRHHKLALPSDEVILLMDEVTEELCREAGFEHYEVSNYARPGYRCRHNLVYWRNDPYGACGAAAVSYWETERAKRVADPATYCQLIETGQTPIAEHEQLDRESQCRETIIMGLRLIEGVDLDRLRARFHGDIDAMYGSRLDLLQRKGLLIKTESRLYLTAKGRQVANVVLAELV